MNRHRQQQQQQRDAEIYRLRLMGYSPEEIATSYDLAPATVVRIIQDVHSALHQTDANTQKELELLRLDRLLKKAIKVLETRHVAVSHGRVVYHADPNTNTARPIIDDGPTLDAIKTVLNIMERRAKLLGLDAPTNLNITSPPDPLSIELQEMLNEAKAHNALANQTASPTTEELISLLASPDEEEDA